MVVDNDGRAVDMGVVFFGGMEGVCPIDQAIPWQADLKATMVAYSHYRCLPQLVLQRVTDDKRQL